MLTEREILAALKENLKGAADDCELIATRYESGAHFDRMRNRLRSAEKSCKQLAYYREDARWLNIGWKMERAHQIARTWLHRPSVKIKKMFTLLAGALRQMAVDLERLETERTMRRGMILPKPQRHHREGKPVAVLLPKVTKGGIILP